MGCSASSQSTDDGTIDNRANEQSNFGLVNIASKSLNVSSLNFIEIFTFILVGLTALYFLQLWCEKRRRQKLQSIRNALQGVQVDHTLVQPHETRVPVIQNPLPAPAQLPANPGMVMKTPQEILGTQIMSQYSM